MGVGGAFPILLLLIETGSASNHMCQPEVNHRDFQMELMKSCHNGHDPMLVSLVHDSEHFSRGTPITSCFYSMTTATPSANPSEMVRSCCEITVIRGDNTDDQLGRGIIVRDTPDPTKDETEIKVLAGRLCNGADWIRLLEIFNCTWCDEKGEPIDANGPPDPTLRDYVAFVSLFRECNLRTKAGFKEFLSRFHLENRVYQWVDCEGSEHEALSRNYRGLSAIIRSLTGTH